MPRSADTAKGSVPRVSLADRPAPIFQSILFARPEDRSESGPGIAPACFVDLHLDQIIEAISAGRDDPALIESLRSPLTNIDAIQFRHEVFRDLENEQLLGAVRAFTRDMGIVRDNLANAFHIHQKPQANAWFLDAVRLYGEALTSLAQELKASDPASHGLTRFREHLGRHISSESFERLGEETTRLKAGLAEVRYCLDIKSDRINVRKYEAEEEYSSAVLATFERFRQGAVREFAVKRPAPARMNDIEAAILDLVAGLFPELFAELEAYRFRNDGFLDATIADFDREIQFYIVYRDYMAGFKAAGLSFCYPEMSATDKTVSGEQCFDLALARKLQAESRTPVCNDFHIEGAERILVISGPNQGGKTTFARSFGQMHFLASLGCPVPGETARLFLFDRIFTHFEREETIASERGRLEDDLVRIHEILSEATPSSVIIMNEIFGSTMFSDALSLSKKILARIVELDLLCVFVTFIEELATLNEKTVSLVGTVDDRDPEKRTYKILRRPADGLAHAISIAEKYRLTYNSLKARIVP
jgi:DNA mismatch repair protein MutS